MSRKRFLVFVAQIMAAHVTTYFLAGAVFYPLLTKPYLCWAESCLCDLFADGS